MICSRVFQTQASCLQRKLCYFAIRMAVHLIKNRFIDFLIDNKLNDVYIQLHYIKKEAEREVEY